MVYFSLKFREYTITERTLDAVEPKTVTVC